MLKTVSSIPYREVLNPQQLEVVFSPPGKALVLAGPGSGKTRTLIYRVAWLLESGVSPREIVLVTFTNRSAKEMLGRVKELLGHRVTGLLGGTFHHIGNLLLRRFAERAGYTPNFTILDENDAENLLKEAVREAGLEVKGKKFPSSRVLRQMTGLKTGCLCDLKTLLEERFPYFSHLEEPLERVFQAYARKKRALDVMDFDDLLENWYLLLQNPEVNQLLSGPYQHILVDEYQDTNRLQARIVDLLAGEEKSLMVVGDDAQSIYSFRGAQFENIAEFPQNHPGCRVYKLETSYRCSPEILELANQSISQNSRQFEKILQPVMPPGEKPALIQARDVQEETAFLTQKIKELNEAEHIPLSKMAVLYRSHYHSLYLQMELNRKQIPYQVRSGLKFFEQAHIKDAVSYLKILQNPRDELSWRRILKILPGVGDKTVEKIYPHLQGDGFGSLTSPELTGALPKKAREHWAGFAEFLGQLSRPDLKKQPGKLLELLLKGPYDEYLKTAYENYPERKEELIGLSAFAKNFSALSDFLGEVILQESMMGEELNLEEENREALVLSTIHRAKGLEWEAVFLIHLGEGLFPSAYSLESETELAEERRVFYVAVTRAKTRLYMTYPLRSDRGYNWMVTQPSRFLTELPGEVCEKWRLSRVITEEEPS